MSVFKLTSRITNLVLLTVIVGGSILGFQPSQNVAAKGETLPAGQAAAPASAAPATLSATASVTNTMYLPLMRNGYPWNNPFGSETASLLSSGSTVYSKAVDLNLGWMRLNGRVSWRDLQPNEGDPINWALLERFENELISLNAAGITPVVVLANYPDWAAPYPCGPVNADKFGAYAQFVRAVVARYKVPQFNVHNWEIGNEIDIDPTLLQPQNRTKNFGCWGDQNDPFYGGGYYGNMLKVVSPQIRAEDPSAKIWLGGLLLDKPNSPSNGGRPEQFLEGILQSGAASDFDILPFHAYTNYYNQKLDYDNQAANAWLSYGNGTLAGKVKFIRNVLAQYNVDKPLYANETGLMCSNEIVDPNNPNYMPWCATLTEDYVDMQATQLVRSFARGLSLGISGFSWYTLDGPGWRQGGLLFDQSLPRPAYLAYQQLVNELKFTTYAAPVNYGDKIEGYTFVDSNKAVEVVWAKNNGDAVLVSLPAGSVLSAQTRGGSPISVAPQGGLVNILVKFEPVYIVRPR